MSSSTADLAKLITYETEKWSKVVRALNIKLWQDRSGGESIFHSVGFAQLLSVPDDRYGSRAAKLILSKTSLLSPRQPT